ncbi:MAG: class I SAM-dependent methyltransferase [Endomicrobia bacterium]|nr:class I SAM-dependent methyltransferase [Endomicrobiia bacterium]
MQKKNSYFLTRYNYDIRRQKVWQVIAEYLQKKYIPEDSIIIDIGAGYCNFINNIKAKEKYAVDSWEDFIKYANNDVKTYIAECQNLSFLKAEFFDIIFSSNLLEHLSIEDIDKTLDEFYRILKFGGKLILLLPNFRYCYKIFYDDYTHITPLTHIGIKDLLTTKSFKIINLEPRFLPFSFKSNFPINKFVVSLYLKLPFKPFAGQMLIVSCKAE